MIERIRSFLNDHGIFVENGELYIGVEPPSKANEHNIKHRFITQKTQICEDTYPDYVSKSQRDPREIKATFKTFGDPDEYKYMITHCLFTQLNSKFDTIGDTIDPDIEHGDEGDIVKLSHNICVSELHELTHWALTAEEDESVDEDHWHNWAKVMWEDVINHIETEDIEWVVENG